MRGMDQRRAYVSVSMWYGDMRWFENPIPEEEADRKLTDFVSTLSASQIDWGQVKP